MWKRFTAAGLVVFSAGFGYKYNTDDQLKRNITLWKELGPIITHYRLIELKQKYITITEQESDAEYHALHQKYSSI